jgi:hypothetical protein
MPFNIKTGFGGVIKRENHEIVILVTEPHAGHAGPFGHLMASTYLVAVSGSKCRIAAMRV